MTHIVRFPTKKAFKEAVAAGKLIECSDPAVVNPHDVVINGGQRLNPVDITVTNHPQRTWFARVTCDVNGKWRVE